MDSTSTSSVSYKTNLPQLPVGYVFNPNEDEIYSYFIPKRILERQPMVGVEEFNLYDKSPDELFRNRDPRKHIYLFTRLKKEKETHIRIKRTAGGGTWLGQKPTPCCRVLFDGGEEANIGTMRQFTYRGGADEWVMHEYSIEDDFLNYIRVINNGCPNNGANANSENIVFCHIYKKKAKKGNNEEIVDKQKKRKRNSNNYEENHEENVNGFNNNVSSVQAQEENTAWMPNYNNGPQPLVPEPLQAYDWSNNVDQGHPLVPQGGDDFFMMQNYGHNDQGFIAQEPTYYPPITETYNEDGNDWFSIEELFAPE